MKFSIWQRIICRLSVIQLPIWTGRAYQRKSACVLQKRLGSAGVGPGLQTTLHVEEQASDYKHGRRG